MTKPRVYIETTIPSYLTAWPSEEHIRAPKQELTRTWWDTRRGDFDICTSQYVLDECGAGDPNSAQLRLEALREVGLLDVYPSAEALAQEFLNSQALPPNAAFDAAHIALATVHSVSYLLTWNCRHIANAAIRTRLARICLEQGWILPVICTPEELMEPKS